MLLLAVAGLGNESGTTPVKILESEVAATVLLTTTVA